MASPELIAAAARSIASLAPSVSGLDGLERELADIECASQRGWFTPDEDERVRVRFAEYLAARAALLQTITDLKPIARAAMSNTQAVNEEDRLRAFTISYAATAMLVRAGRFLIQRFAPNKIIQRKLNEAEPRFGIPRKQFTAVYRSLTHPLNALQIQEAMRFADEHRSDIEALASDPLFCETLDHLHESEPALRVRRREYASAYLRYRWHAWRRRRASFAGQATFGLLEMAGRIVAEVHNPWRAKRITPKIRNELAEILQPGDVLLSRHDDAASNLFLPGFWVHASLHIGAQHDREQLQCTVDPQRASRWVDPIRMLEAKKDGVRFRPMEETLAVDAVAVLRPKLGASHVAEAISRAVEHEGKLYDFEFDFFRSDRLVCTEVVYRGYHGVGGIDFQLSRRAGRPTLAAEDLLKMALLGNGFEPVAVVGTANCPDSIHCGADAKEILAQSIKG